MVGLDVVHDISLKAFHLQRFQDSVTNDVLSTECSTDLLVAVHSLKWQCVVF